MTSGQIKEIRLAKGLDQKEFGDALGVSKTTICCWENGHTDPRASSIKKILAYCQQNNIKF